MLDKALTHHENAKNPHSENPYAGPRVLSVRHIRDFATAGAWVMSLRVWQCHRFEAGYLPLGAATSCSSARAKLFVLMPE